MARHSALYVLVAGGIVLAAAAESIEARHMQAVGTRPGIGVSGVGVPAPYVPAPGVSTSTVPSAGVMTPMATGNPGVESRHTKTNAVINDPGHPARHVETPAIESQPGVTAAAPAVPSLPSGYYTAIPGDAEQVMHKGELVYSVKGKFYRPEYYMGNIVYVAVK